MSPTVGDLATEGLDPNYDPYIISITSLQALAWSMTATSVLLTAGRLAIRWNTIRKIGLDDWLNTVAALLCIPFVVTTMQYLPDEYWAQRYYLGLGGELPSQERQILANKLELATLILFWLIIYLVKASFLALYWHLFRVSSKFLVVWWFTTGFIILSFLVTMTSILWKCGRPVDLINLDACSGMPMQIAINLMWIWCSLNIAGGILLMALPIFMVTSRLLTLEKMQKVGLIFVFCLVLIDIAFDIVRTVYALTMELSARTNLPAVWTICEPTIAVIVCALPTYKKFLSFKRWRNSSSIGSFRSFKNLQVTEVPMELSDVSGYTIHSRSQLHQPV
ncbi:hypothetical protein B0J11DRAFT_100471 [Dendryphion nanum]|uniref:Rhodopsin domain-containing protein n=1 Tax=Dendryphion nanum TaxID=256645 RepID=A0A9P9IED1_9PLEO|nr:hypothetical protein B0J11DRAFT_100471 [Dendryphion nanum]